MHKMLILAVCAVVVAGIAAVVAVAPYGGASSARPVAAATPTSVPTTVPAGPVLAVATPSPANPVRPPAPPARPIPVKPVVPADPSRFTNGPALASPNLGAKPSGGIHAAGANSASVTAASCLTGVNYVSTGYWAFYNEGAIPVMPAVSTCSPTMQLNYWVYRPTTGWASVDSLTVQDTRNNGGVFYYVLTNDDNILPLQNPAGNYQFAVCADVCVYTPSTYLSQNPVTSANGCNTSRLGDASCQWYAKNRNTTGDTATYNQYSVYPYTVTGEGTTDWLMANMLVSQNNNPGDVGEIYQWLGAYLSNRRASGFIQAGIAYAGSGKYNAFFYTEEPISAGTNICVGAGTTGGGTNKCEHPVAVGTTPQIDMHVVGSTLWVGINGVAFVQMPISSSPRYGGMNNWQVVSELITARSTFQATYNGHDPSNPTSRWTPLKADFYTDVVQYESNNGTVYQFNGINRQGQGDGDIFAPYGNAAGTRTYGFIDCGAITELQGTQNGANKWTAWHFAANYILSQGHC